MRMSEQTSNCGCSTDLPPVLIEIPEEGPDDIKFSGKCEQDIDQMVKALDASATPAKLYCHTCGLLFDDRSTLDWHKNILGHK